MQRRNSIVPVDIEMVPDASDSCIRAAPCPTLFAQHISFGAYRTSQPLHDVLRRGIPSSEPCQRVRMATAHMTARALQIDRILPEFFPEFGDLLIPDGILYINPVMRESSFL